MQGLDFVLERIFARGFGGGVEQWIEYAAKYHRRSRSGTECTTRGTAPGHGVQAMADVRINLSKESMSFEQGRMDDAYRGNQNEHTVDRGGHQRRRGTSNARCPIRSPRIALLSAAIPAGKALCLVDIRLPSHSHAQIAPCEYASTISRSPPSIPLCRSRSTHCISSAVRTRDRPEMSRGPRNH